MFKCHLRDVLLSLFLRGKVEKYKRVKKAAREGVVETTKYKGGFLRDFDKRIVRCCSRRPGVRRPRRKYGPLRRIYMRVSTPGTYWNFVAKSFFGFICGVVLTYCTYLFFMLQLGLELEKAFFICSVFGLLTTLFLAFSSSARCFYMMLLPSVFSRSGRNAVTAYAIILVLTGPARNVLFNVQILTEALICAEDQLSSVMQKVVDMVKSPIYAIRDAVKHVANKMKEVTAKFSQILQSIQRMVTSLAGSLKLGLEWLNDCVTVCSHTVGTPYTRCQNSFKRATADCKVKLGPMFNWMCSVGHLTKVTCYTVKLMDLMCDMVEYVTDDNVEIVLNKFEELARRVKNMFYVDVVFNHTYNYKMQFSKTVKEMSAGVVYGIRKKLSFFYSLFDLLSLSLLIFMLLIIISTVRYKRKYLTSLSYDNCYMTEDITLIDLRRASMSRDTILPLSPKEKDTYIPIYSWHLTLVQKVRRMESVVYVLFVILKIGFHLMLDFSLWWILMLFREYGKYTIRDDVPKGMHARVEGKGLVSDLHLSIIRAFEPEKEAEMETDSLPCLPDPSPYNNETYKKIGYCMLWIFLLAWFEPYGLRMRSVVMNYYYPRRAKQRAVWLYNRILNKRENLLKRTRRHLKLRYTKGNYGESYPMLAKLTNCIPLLKLCIATPETLLTCLLCGKVEEAQGKGFIKCTKVNCPGRFCPDCFLQLKRVCTLCMKPIEYGDYSDISEEEGSMEEGMNDELWLEARARMRASMAAEKMRSEHRPGTPRGSLSAAIDDSDDSSKSSSNLSYTYQTRGRQLESGDESQVKCDAGFVVYDSADIEEAQRAKLDYAEPDILTDGSEEYADEASYLKRLFYAIIRPEEGSDNNDQERERSRDHDIDPGATTVEENLNKTVADDPIAGKAEPAVQASSSQPGGKTLGSSGKTSQPEVKFAEVPSEPEEPSPGPSGLRTRRSTDSQIALGRSHPTFRMISEGVRSPFRLLTSSSSGLAVSDLLRPLRRGRPRRGADRTKVAHWVRTGRPSHAQEDVELLPTGGRSEDTVVRMEESTSSEDERMSTSEDEESPRSASWAPRKKF